jgi:hypothetical protein
MHEASRQRSIIIVLAAVVLVAAAAAWAMTGSASDSPGSGQGSPASSESSGDAAAAGEDTGSTGAGQAGSGKAGSGETGSGGGDSGTNGAGAGKSRTQGSDATGGGGTDKGSDKGGGGDGGGDTGDDATTDEATTDEATTDVEEPGTATGETVPVEPVQTMAPVPLQSVGDFKTGLTVELASIVAVQAEAKAPGEISGPGLRVTVAAANDGEDAVSLDTVVVFLSYGSDRTPATQFGSSSEPLAGDLAPGSSRQGTYVFTVPTDQRDDVRVEVSYTGSAPTVAFTGSVDG